MRALARISLTLLFAGLATAAFSQLQVTTVSSTSLTDVRMINSTVGYAAGVDGIFKTTDGGQTWDLQPAFEDDPPFTGDPLFLGMNDHHLHFTDASNGISVGWNVFGNSEEIIVTSDGGATWTVVHNFNPDPAPSQPLELRLRFIESLGSGNFITGGYRGRILRSTNNGNAWTAMTSNTSRDLEGVSFLNASDGMAVGDRVVIITSDGGSTWSAIETIHSFLDVKMINSLTALAITNGGKVMRSEDGGQTWNEMFEHHSLTDIAFIDDETGFITGWNLVYKTTNGGSNFEKVSIDEVNSPHMISRIHPLTENQFALVTSDGEFLFNNGPGLSYTPQAGFYTLGTICSNASTPLHFQNIGSPGYSYEWYINGQLTSTEYDLDITFTSSGPQTVTQIAINGGDQESTSRVIQVEPGAVIASPIGLSIDFGPPPDTIEIVVQTPMTLRASNLTDGAFYQLFRNDDPISARIEAVQFHMDFDLPVVPAGEYEYKVKGDYTTVCGVATTQALFTIVIINTPRSPENLRLYHGLNNTIRLTWDETSQQVESYVVERRTEGSGSWLQVGIVNADVPAEEREFIDGGMTPAQHYYYRVAAINASGQSPYSDIEGISVFDQVIYVNHAATGSNRGTSWADAFTDFGDATLNSVSDLEIWVAKGTYKPMTLEGWSAFTKGVYGGFTGNETSKSQSDSRLNKTILSGEMGVPGLLGDNTHTILVIQQGGVVKGFTIRDAFFTGLISYGLVEHCVVENNNLTGIDLKIGGEIANCVVRNNGFGIITESDQLISNTFIYANDYGVLTPEARVYHSVYYQNPDGNVGTSDDATNNISQEMNRLGNVGTVVPPGQEIQPGQYLYPLNYLGGIDGILGNDDDVFHFPEPELIDCAHPHDISFESLTGFIYDFEGNPRGDNMVSDVGPIEYLPDPWPTPPVLTVSDVTATSVIVHWPEQTDPEVVGLWLKVIGQNGPTLIPLANEFVQHTINNLDPNHTYRFELRLQRGLRVSRPGPSLEVTTPKQTQVIQNFDDVTTPLGVNVFMQPIMNPGLAVTFSSDNHAVAVFSGQSLVPVGTGTTTITASNDGNDTYFPIAVTKTLIVTKGTQTLSGLSDKTKQLPADLSFTMPATTNTGLTVTYGSSDLTVATVNVNVIELVAGGTAVITATQAGNDDYDPVSGQFNLTVLKTNQTLLNTGDVSKTYGNADFTLAVTVNSGLTPSFSSSDPAIATVTGSLVHIVKAGSVTINISQAGNGSYNPVTGSLTLTIAKASQNLTGLTNRSFFMPGEQVVLPGSSTASLPVVYSSNDPLVATVGGNTVTPVGAGTAIISASQAGNDNYLPVSGQFNFELLKNDQTLADMDDYEVEFGVADFPLPVTASSGLAISLSSLDPTIATTSGQMIHVVKAGTVTIQVSQSGNGSYNPVSGTLVLIISKATQSLTGIINRTVDVDDADLVLPQNSSAMLPVTYSSNNSQVAAVAGNVVELVGGGTVTIFASQAGDDNYLPVYGQFTLTVEGDKANQVLMFIQEITKIFGAADFAPEISASSGLPVTLSSSDESVATTSGTTIHIVKGGTVAITITQAGDDDYYPISETFTLTILKGIQQLPDLSGQTVKKLGSAPLALASVSSGGLPVHYTSSNPELLVVNNFALEFIGVGEASVTAHVDGNESYLPFDVTWPFSITKGDQVLSGLSDITKTFGASPFQINVSNSAGLPVSLALSNNLVIKLTGNVAETIGAGAVVITASSPETANYFAAIATALITVDRAAAVITFDSPGNLTFGSPPVALIAQSTANVPLSFSATPALATVNNGILTLLAPGQITITATHLATANYLAPTPVSQTICINPAKPEIELRVEPPQLISSAATGNQWYLNGQLLSGQVSRTLDVTVGGIYTVRTTVGGCQSSLSAEMSVVVTGVDRKQIPVMLFPNPASEFVVVTGLANDAAVSITSSVGVDLKLSRSLNADGSTQFDVRTLSPGVYFVNVKGEVNLTMKFVK